jgi:hypothetical protein
MYPETSATLLTFIRCKHPRAESKFILIPLYVHASNHILLIRFYLLFSSIRRTCSCLFIFFLVSFSLLLGHIFLNI